MRARLFTDENRKWWTLLAVSFGLFMIMLDNTVVNVALAAIGRSFHVHGNYARLEWVVNAYALTIAVLLLTGGKLADFFGRRRVFLLGLAIFAVSSLFCGLAGSAGELIAARAVQGVGAALMLPSTLSIITATFPPRERGAAIGIWAGTSAIALAIGPLVGGVITEHINWSWIFYINVPIGALGILLGRLVIDESRDTSHEQRLDLPGLLASGVGLLALTTALIEGGHSGWAWGSGRVIGLLAAAAVALVAFVVLELRQRLPMFDLSLFRSGTFAGANVVALLVGLAMFGVFFFVSLYMQNILGYSPVRAGASFLPMTSLIIIVAPLAGRLSDRIGSRWLMATGMTLTSGSLVIFSQLTSSSSWWNLFPGMLVGGLGMAITITPTTAAALSAVPVAKAGVGAGVVNTFRQIGLVLGIAVMGAILTARQNSSLAAGDPPDVAFVHGLSHAMLIGSGVALSAAVVAAVTVRTHRQVRPAELAEATA